MLAKFTLYEKYLGVRDLTRGLSLGEDGIVQIGKANWETIGAGELYTGYLDEYAIRIPKKRL
ncbi:MAG: hypothetical protein J6A75_07665 [Lachnospiraceae bacterium]|nr:hypothetical protein [Lachnospiraceae bacterium]